jgi:uncharacterized phage protein (TIGR02220 family)
MREFAKISPQIWINESGRKIKKLGPETFFVSFYLLSNPHACMIGIYYLPVAFIAHETGLSIEQASSSLRNLCEVGFCTYDLEAEYVWVHEMASTQIGTQLTETDNRVKAINQAYAALPKLSFLRAFYEKYSEAYLLDQRSDIFFEASPEPLRSKEKENDKENKKENDKANETRMTFSGKPDIPTQKNIFNAHKNYNNTSRQQQEALYRAQATEILELLNVKAERNYRIVDANLKLVIDRLKTGVSVWDCRQVVAKKCREWKKKKMDAWLRPATLFKDKNFEQYLGELVVPKEDLAEELPNEQK